MSALEALEQAYAEEYKKGRAAAMKDSKSFDAGRATGFAEGLLRAIEIIKREGSL